MGTRYQKGDTVEVTASGTTATVTAIEQPKSDSPTYVLEDGQGKVHTVKASQIRKQDEVTYAVGGSHTGNRISISFEEMEEKFPSLSVIADTPYRGERTESLSKLRQKGYEPLAWTPNVRYLYYHPEKEILVKDIEGDLYITENPSANTLEEAIQQFPKGEVSLGEKYDSRFGSDRGVEPKWKRKAREELETQFNTLLNQSDDSPNVGDSSKGAFALWSDNGEYEFDVFKSREQARRNAKQQIKEEVEMNPEMFSGWVITDNMYIGKTDKRMIAQEEARHIYEGIPDDEVIEEAKGYGLRADNPDVAREQLESKRKEEIQEKLDDPIKYFVEERGIYSREELMEQSFIRIDSDSVAEDVIDNDGITHAISIYGNVHDLPSGAVAYKVI